MECPGGGARLMIESRTMFVFDFYSQTMSDFDFLSRTMSVFHFDFTGTCSNLSEIFFYREKAEASWTTTKLDIICQTMCQIPQPGQPPDLIEIARNLSIVGSYSPYRFVESWVVGLSINQTKNVYVSMYVKHPKRVKVKKIKVNLLNIILFYLHFTLKSY